MNTFGDLFRLTTFGESHGTGLGAVIDGCPAGVTLSREQIQAALDRRRPGQSAVSTARAEADTVEILSGLFEGKTLGTPLAAVVRNHDARSQDYASLTPAQRPGHADAVWLERYKHRDPRGGGRTSGRETLARVIGGVVAEALLARDVPALRIVGWVSRVGPLIAPTPEAGLTRAQVDATAVRCPDLSVAAQMEKCIVEAKEKGDSWGGHITIRVEGMPIGWGEPVFGKLKARLASGLASVGAVTGVIWGPEDLESRLALPGTAFHAQRDAYGGIQGGLSNGEPLQLRVYFKPPATLSEVAKAGRHDPCIMPRAVPVLEAMTALVLADALLAAAARKHQP
jgi:chorismate synthase